MTAGVISQPPSALQQEVNEGDHANFDRQNLPLTSHQASHMSQSLHGGSEHHHHHAAPPPTEAELANPMELPMTGQNQSNHSGNGHEHHHQAASAASTHGSSNQVIHPMTQQNQPPHGVMGHNNHHAAPAPLKPQFSSQIALPMTGHSHTSCTLPDSRILDCSASSPETFSCSVSNKTALTGSSSSFTPPAFMPVSFPMVKPIMQPPSGLPGPALPTIPGLQSFTTSGQDGKVMGHFTYSLSFNLPVDVGTVGAPSPIGIPGVVTIPPTVAPMPTPEMPQFPPSFTFGATSRPSMGVQPGTETPMVTPMTPPDRIVSTGRKPFGRPTLPPSLGFSRPLDSTPPPGFSQQMQHVFTKVGPSPALAGLVGGIGSNVTLGATGGNRTRIEGFAPFGEISNIIRDPKLPSCAYLLQTRIPDRQYCDRYHVCTTKGLVGEFCPDGLVFDIQREECHLPGSVNCTGRPLRQPPQRAGPCPRRNGVFPIQGSCTKFLICSNGTYGVVECPAGLAFSFSLGACEWPDVAGVPGCKSEQLFNFTCPPVSEEMGFLRVANPRDCRTYYVCLPNRSARLLSCPGGTVFSPVNAVCDAPQRVPGCETYYGIPAPPSAPMTSDGTQFPRSTGGTIDEKGDPVEGQAPFAIPPGVLSFLLESAGQNPFLDSDNEIPFAVASDLF
ncbi:uncharacterized protein LOC136026960 isoform X2 [Artemia franciscana]|uniref:uncharacterized protein LOC136026960 isoform X2 n=1 Tax=Artemia franciscana TaxID=6661 RepID=UPI0032DABED1